MIELRSWQEDDLPLLERAAEDDYVAMIVHLPVPFAREDALAWIAGRPATDFAVVAGAEPVGGAGFTPRHVPGYARYGAEPRRDVYLYARLA